MKNFLIRLLNLNLYHVRIFYLDDRQNGLLGTFLSVKEAKKAIETHCEFYCTKKWINNNTYEVTDRFGNVVNLRIQFSKLSKVNFSNYKPIQ